MAWTTENLVRAMIDVDEKITDLSPFIEAAHQLLLTHCKKLNESNGVEVETWLTAHLLTIRDNRIATEGVAEASVTYQFKIDLGLASSMYGQTAMALDGTGELARWNKQILGGSTQAKINWLGENKAEE